MKQLAKLFPLMLVFLGVIACSKKDDNSSTGNTLDFNLCAVETQLFPDGSKKMFTYTEAKTVSKILLYDDVGTEPYDELTYTYTGSTVTFTNKSGREKGTVTLGTNGLASDKSITYYQAQDPTQATSNTSESYEYDANNKLTKKSITSSSPGGSFSAQNTYVWSNGNIVKIITTGSGTPVVTDSIAYDLLRTNPLSSFDNSVKFTGYGTKNLPVKVYELNTGSIKETIAYDINTEAKSINYSTNGMLQTTYLFKCP